MALSYSPFTRVFPYGTVELSSSQRANYQVNGSSRQALQLEDFPDCGRLSVLSSSRVTQSTASFGNPIS
ncbi:hypothetical protein Tco_0748589 [Tanacetum coccineum]|uniref:Uncharacterized protein n=1 Tax=Tanacetum coccineum TaxID=301880 RepID=A0ABQ4YW48_9ASTR